MRQEILNWGLFVQDKHCLSEERKREKEKREAREAREAGEEKLTTRETEVALAESWLNFEGDSAWSRPTYYLEAVMPSAAELRPSYALSFLPMGERRPPQTLPAASKSQGPAVAYFPLIMQ